METKYALFLISEMYEEWFKKPSSYHQKSIVARQQIYQSWAVKELMEHLHEKPGAPVIETIEDFRSKMSDYACLAKTDEQHFIFSCAYDAISCILDVLRNVDY